MMLSMVSEDEGLAAAEAKEQRQVRWKILETK
jgi:hypothetical protein